MSYSLNGTITKNVPTTYSSYTKYKNIETNSFFSYNGASSNSVAHSHIVCLVADDGTMGATNDSFVETNIFHSDNLKSFQKNDKTKGTIDKFTTFF